jgi:protoheme IX farnesyltransferase
MKLRIASLLLLVAVSGYLVTSGPAVEPVPLTLLLASGLLASGGASAVNHYFDRDIDRIMTRTRGRPIPAGRVPPANALVFGSALMGIALVLALLVNVLTAAFIALGFVVYVFVYTVGLKRRNVSNIVIGGFAGSCPALAGSAAASGAVALGAALIAVLVFIWTPGHFWALAFRQREDYRLAGLPMLPAVMDERTASRWIVVSTAIVPPFALSFWVLNVSGLAYLGVAIVAGAILLFFAFRFLESPTIRNAWVGYRASGPYLAVVLLALIADRMLQGL